MICSSAAAAVCCSECSHHALTLLLQVAIDVQQNPFEKHRVALVGECYLEALALVGLPQDCTDELRLPDLPLNQAGRTAFALRNMSDKPYRSGCFTALCALPAASLSHALHAGS